MYRLKIVTLEDLPWLRLLNTKWHAEQPSPRITMDEEEFDRYILYIARQLNDPNFLCVLAFIGHRAIGYLTSIIIERAYGKPQLLVRGLEWYVIPKHRGRGVARLLLGRLAHWAREHNLTHLEFNAAPGASIWSKYDFTLNTVDYATTFDELSTKLLRPKLKVSA